MSVVSKLASAFQRKRLAGLLIVASLCPLIGACGDDDKAADTSAVDSSTGGTPADNNAQRSKQDTLLSSSPAPAVTVTIQTPALAASGADAALSAAASAPLVTPVIHTVD